MEAITFTIRQFCCWCSGQSREKYTYLHVIATAVNIHQEQNQGTDLQMSWSVNICCSVFGLFSFLVCKCLDAHSESLVAMATCEPASTSLWGAHFLLYTGCVHMGIPLNNSAEAVGSSVTNQHPTFSVFTGKRMWHHSWYFCRNKVISPHPLPPLQVAQNFFLHSKC